MTPTRIPPPAHTLSELFATAASLGDDELEVLTLIAERIAAGRDVYGELAINTDRRAYVRECLEEAADGLVYVAAALIRAKRGRTARRSARCRRVLV